MEAVEQENTDEKEIEPEVKAKGESEIVALLSATGYRTREYSNGICMGLALKPIPGSRGVHVDIVHVLDMRNAKFGRTPLAMQSAVLESINKRVELCLEDAGIGDRLITREVVAPHGTREITALRTNSGSSSALHETRSVYVVYANDSVGPRDLDWLTDTSRVIRANEFSLLQKSDSRSLQQEVKNSIKDSKWNDLNIAYRTSWMSILPLITFVASCIGIAASLITGTGSILLPFVVAALSLPAFLYLYRKADSHFSAFDESRGIEFAKISSIGDGSRLRTTASANEEKMKLVGDLNFVVTPLMGGAIVAAEDRDIDAAASSLVALMDECVLHSPLKDAPKGSERGLLKFLKLFEELGTGFDEDQAAKLGVAYTAISGHIQSPVDFNELLQHIATLTQALFDCGILTREVKDSFDDNLNFTGMKKYVDDHPMPVDVPIPPVPPKASVVPSETDVEEIDEDALAEMAAAGLDVPSSKSSEVDTSGSSEEVDSPVDESSTEVSDSEKEPVSVAETIQTKLSEDGSEAEAPMTGSEVVEIVRSKRKSKETGSTMTAKEREAVKA